MKKLLKQTIVFLVLFSAHFCDGVFAEDRIDPARQLLKQEIISSLSNRIEIIGDNTCYFKPANKIFNSKIVVNCDRIFDSLLDELTSGEPKTFEENELTTIKQNLNPAKLIHLLKFDLQFLRTRLPDKLFLEEDKNEVIIEICKTINTILDNPDQRFVAVYPDLKEAMFYYKHEVESIILDLAFENSVAKMANLFREKLNESYVTENGNRNYEFLFLIDVLYGDREETKSKVLELISQSPNLSLLSLKTVLEKLAPFETENVLFFSSLVNIIDKCVRTNILPYREICASTTAVYGQNVSALIARLYYENLKEYLSTQENANVNLDELKLRVDIYEEHNSYLSFKSNFLDQYLLNPRITDLEKSRKICLLFANENCLVKPNLAPVAQKRFAGTYLISLLAVASLVGFLTYFWRARRKLKFTKKSFTAEDVQRENILDLNHNERSELRDLRDYFDLKPLDTTLELHRNYRKMVFKFHPDKLKDGGAEFVVLQARYLQAKDLLERLERERAKKVSNS